MLCTNCLSPIQGQPSTWALHPSLPSLLKGITQAILSSLSYIIIVTFCLNSSMIKNIMFYYFRCTIQLFSNTIHYLVLIMIIITLYLFYLAPRSFIFAKSQIFVYLWDSFFSVVSLFICSFFCYLFVLLIVFFTVPKLFILIYSL